MKKFWITLLSVLTLALCLFGVVACNKGGKVLANYVLSQDGTLVEEDFVLPSKVSDKEVKWTSDNAAIAVEKRADDYLAKVDLGDEAVSVKLTVTCGKESKEFHVTVAALDVSMFVKKFSFKQDHATVYEDFELPTSFTVNGKTANIVWSVDREQDRDYISVADKDSKKVCTVKESTLNPEVRLYAEFEYKGQKQKTNFRMTVSFPRGHVEEVDYWYYNTGVSITMSGYVVAVATAYSEQYKNINIYMVDDDFCAGYYIYRVTASKDDAAKIKPGVHVTVTGTTNTNYNGLVETNAGGTLKVDDDKQAVDVSQHVYALDKDLLAGAPAALYHTSTLVSLTGWEVVEKASKAPADGTTAVLFTLQKNSVKVGVAVSKYMEGVYAAKAGNATYDALIAKYKDIKARETNKDGTVKKAGDVVNVTGILGNNKGFQIMPLKADDIVKADAASEAPAACTKVFNAIREVQSIFNINGVTSFADDANVCFKPDSGYIVVADKEFDVPAENNGVEIKYEVIHTSDSVKIENNKVKVTVGKEDIASIKVTYTVRDGETVLYTTDTYHTLHTKLMNAEQIVDDIWFNLELEKKSTTVDAVQLPTTVKEYPGATIEWKLKEPVTGVTIENGLLDFNLDSTQDRALVLVATISYGEGAEEKTLTKEFDFKLNKVSAVETGELKFALEQKNLEKKLYFTGEISGRYGSTSEFYADAATVVVAHVEGTKNDYTFKVGEKYLEIALNSEKKVTLALSDSSNLAWNYDYDLKVFTATLDKKVYFLGTYSTFNTISASETSYISGKNAENVGKTQFVALFEKPATQTDAQKVADAVASGVKLANVEKVGNVVLPTAKNNGVTLTWTLAADTTVATLTGNTLTVATLPAEDTEVTLTYVAHSGSEESEPQTVKFTVKKAKEVGASAKFDFANVVGKGDAISNSSTALSIFTDACETGTGIESITLTTIYAGNGTGGPLDRK